MEATAPLLPYWSWPILAAAISALLTEAAIRYARRRALFDQPGQRRMHAVATPRGGGIGIVVALLLLVTVQWPHADGALRPLLAAGALGLAAVAAVGSWDDHFSIGAMPRLLVQLFAALVFVAAIGSILLRANAGSADPATTIVVAGIGIVFVLGIVWSINLHNFMDGINGILGMQAAFVFGGFAFLATGIAGWFCFAAAAAVVAFLPFNFPKPRVFMGDVGSGALGFAIAALALSGVANEINIPLALILDSAFVVDAGATLCSRMIGGRRWYSAHREHLYQWLARSGFSHAQVVGLYVLWNLCIALPCALLFARWNDVVAAVSTPDRGVLRQLAMPPFWLIPAVLTLGTIMWVLGKRWCLRHARTHARARLLARAAARTRGDAHAH